MTRSELRKKIKEEFNKDDWCNLVPIMEYVDEYIYSNRFSLISLIREKLPDEIRKPDGNVVNPALAGERRETLDEVNKILEEVGK